jgi:uncharacterized RDD family membrane protein YckC
MPGQPAGGYPGTMAPMGPGGRPMSEWWKRLVAFILDGIIVGIPTSIILNVIGVGLASTSVDPNTGAVTSPGLLSGALFFTILLSVLIPIVYFGLMNGGEKGQTVGKMALKIQVRDEATGGPIGIGRAFLRYLVYAALAGFTCGIGGLVDGLWPLWDPKRQALHDKAIKSVVVDV